MKFSCLAENPIMYVVHRVVSIELLLFGTILSIQSALTVLIILHIHFLCLSTSSFSISAAAIPVIHDPLSMLTFQICYRWIKTKLYHSVHSSKWLYNNKTVLASTSKHSLRRWRWNCIQKWNVKCGNANGMTNREREENSSKRQVLYARKNIKIRKTKKYTMHIQDPYTCTVQTNMNTNINQKTKMKTLLFQFSYSEIPP